MADALLQEAVLQATDPLNTHGDAPLQRAEQLLRDGACARGCLQAMVELHELYFEATDVASATYTCALRNAQHLIPLLLHAGDTVTPQMLQSAKYNCAPLITEMLHHALNGDFDTP